MLDAYDARGRVPAHLQAPLFLRALAAVIAPGGAAVANLFHGSAAARAACAAFAAELRAALGGAVHALRVCGHEDNLVLIAIKPAAAAAAATAAAKGGRGSAAAGGAAAGAAPPLRARLEQAAEAAAARTPAVELPLLQSLRSNAETLHEV